MICYKDKTFCHSDCVNTQCYRYFGEDDRLGSIKWWGDDSAPIAWGDLSKGCEDYIQPNVCWSCGDELPKDQTRDECMQCFIDKDGPYEEVIEDE